jgi:carboxylesterase
MTETSVIPGAEPLSHIGRPIGVLVVHGFTGSPQTMRPVAEALVGADFTVEMPRLPGHGTSIEDMMTTAFDDWSATVEDAYADLAARTDKVVVVGLSMGGTLTCWLAERHPEIAGIVCINALVKESMPEMLEIIDAMLEAGETVSPGIGADIADPDSTEIAYEGTPLVCARSLFGAIEAVDTDLAKISCPVLIMTSPQDHVVDPSNSDHLADKVSGPVERVTLERSYHVATLDYDAALVNERTIDFVEKIAAES